MLNLLYLLMSMILTACTSPQVQESSDKLNSPAQHLEENSTAVMADGYRLPVTAWLAEETPQAIILALHGFNDYRNAFRQAGQFFASHQLTTYAYDQRGFGETSQRGIWPGSGILQADAAAMANLLCDRYPDLPLYLLGESMGGAVAMSMPHPAPCIRGLILSAPAVWGWQTMPFWQSNMLRFAAHMVPAQTLTGEWLDMKPSDNVDMLQALARDPLVIKATRIDAVFGLTNLMEAAFLASSTLDKPTLILYGEKDEIIPHIPTCMMIDQLADTSNKRIILYPQGYHMLMRDLQATSVLQDMLMWIKDQSTALPSGQEVIRTATRLKNFCR